MLLHQKSGIWIHQSQIAALYFAITVDGIFILFVFLFFVCIHLPLYFCSVASELFFFFFDTIIPKQLTVCFYDVLGQSKRKGDCRASLFKEIRHVLGHRWWKSRREEKH